MIEVSAESPDVDALVRALRTHADAKAMKKEFYAGLNRVTKEIRADMKANVNAATTPTRGGLTALMAKSTRITAYAKPGPYAAIGIKVRGRGSLASMNASGSFRRPVFGGRWVPQTAGVRKGLTDEPFNDSSPEVQKALVEVAEDIARKVTSF